MKKVVLALTCLCLFVGLAWGQTEKKVVVENGKLVVYQTTKEAEYALPAVAVPADSVQRVLSIMEKGSGVFIKKGVEKAQFRFRLHFTEFGEITATDTACAYQNGQWQEPSLAPVVKKDSQTFLFIFMLLIPAICLMIVGKISKGKKKLFVFFFWVLIAMMIGTGVGWLISGDAGAFAGAFAGGFAGGFAGAFAGGFADGLAGGKDPVSLFHYFIFVIACFALSFLLRLALDKIKKPKPLPVN